MSHSALKSKGNTPKYGLLYNSTFIGRAEPKCKGRISRYVANKCSIASRIDCFSESLTDKFGLEMKEQVEERLRFYATGDAPRKNVDVMKAVLDSLDIKVISTFFILYFLRISSEHTRLILLQPF